MEQNTELKINSKIDAQLFLNKQAKYAKDFFHFFEKLDIHMQWNETVPIIHHT